MAQFRLSLVSGSIFLFTPYIELHVELGECPVGVGQRGRVLVVGAQLGIADLEDITQRALRQIAGLHPVGKELRDGELRGRVHAVVQGDWRRRALVVVDLHPPEDLVLELTRGDRLARLGCPGQRPHTNASEPINAARALMVAPLRAART